jgi:xanthine dehydrogenase accessory factor
MIDIYKKITELYQQSRNAVLCTIISTKGSTPLKEGAKMIVCENETFGTVGGGSVERQAIERAKALLKSTGCFIENIDLVTDEGSSCGGIVQIFYEIIIQNTELIIFGGGHVGKALVHSLGSLGFDITVVDDRKDIFSNWNDIDCKKITSPVSDYLHTINFHDRLFIAILTYDHRIDWEVLSFCADKPWAYLGMMGSKSKVRTMKQNLSEMGIPIETISKINMPIGLEINAETASEIAVSISAKLVMEKNLLNRKLKNNTK